MTTTIHPPTECARLAAEAISQLNQRTGPGAYHGYRYPSDLTEVLGALEELLSRLPLTLALAARYLHQANDNDQIRCAEVPGPTPTIATISSALGNAAESLDNARAGLELAHHLTTLLTWADR